MDPLPRYEFSGFSLSGLSWFLDSLEARGTRKGEGCVGRRGRPAQRAEAKRTPEQPGRGRRDDP